LKNIDKTDTQLVYSARKLVFNICQSKLSECWCE